ncbi:hypothetical protein HDU85_005905 [Gaertneriomyces sp. JEL0708]|nr:hypothetical protein HDU85_005905 [Gaertneriomyces sp. JEL0708]
MSKVSEKVKFEQSLDTVVTSFETMDILGSMACVYEDLRGLSESKKVDPELREKLHAIADIAGVMHENRMYSDNLESAVKYIKVYMTDMRNKRAKAQQNKLDDSDDEDSNKGKIQVARIHISAIEDVLKGCNSDKKRKSYIDKLEKFKGKGYRLTMAEARALMRDCLRELDLFSTSSTKYVRPNLQPLEKIKISRKTLDDIAHYSMSNADPNYLDVTQVVKMLVTNITKKD